MRKLSLSLKIYLGLIATLAVSNAVQVLLPSYLSLFPAATLPAPVAVIALANVGIAVVLYGGLGFIGLKLGGRLGFADIWDKSIDNRRRFLIPAVSGILLGVVLIITDAALGPFNGIGRFQHPGFPSSIFASISAGIGEEIMFRLFFIPFWVWIISSVVFRGRWRGQIFWVIAVLAALAFALGHLPSLMLLYGFTSPAQISPVLLGEVVMLNGLIAIFAAYYLRKYGFLAAAGVHFWTDIAWHVIWGLF